MENNSGSGYRQGIITAGILGVLTLIEYYVGVYYPSTPLLILLSILKAGIIIQVFMNISRLWSSEEHH